MRDYANQLERRLILAARAEARRRPSLRLAQNTSTLSPAWLTVPIVAGAAVAAVLLFAAGASPPRPTPVVHASVVSFRYPKRGPDSGYIIATVTDPLAAQSSLDAAFKAAGLDITVTLVPASPSDVGTVVGGEETEQSGVPQIQTLVGGSCVTGGGGPGECPIGVKVPRDFVGPGSIEIGRAAAPGEAYVAMNSAFSPGEVLHCSGLINEQVTQALPTIQSDNITAYWGIKGITPLPTFGATSGPYVPDTTTPSGSDYIVDATPVAPGVDWFVVSPTPVSASNLQLDQKNYDQNCQTP